MTTQTDQTITDALQQLTKEVNNLKTELTRIQGRHPQRTPPSRRKRPHTKPPNPIAHLLNEEADEDLNPTSTPHAKKRTTMPPIHQNPLTENITNAKSQDPKQAIANLDTKINQIGDHIEKAKGTPCETCQTKFQKKLKREKRALQTIILVQKTDPQNPQTIDITDVVENFLEPLASPARLKILLSLSQGKKNFSKMAQTMNLKGGHLSFHLKKLLDAQLIAKEDNKCDYIITAKGIDAIKKINIFTETTK
jgi:DNA-binding transcriptional ArsR family regulator